MMVSLSLSISGMNAQKYRVRIKFTRVFGEKVITIIIIMIIIDREHC